ncbi:tyrosine-protein phosphatase non-receptor type 18-like isoform X1 [Acipenser ruthenus]|uniref:tyrosine-protein phosphatase non-receptor type 18-like isoform X1 n=2 Tax=Acipenser ruthenus TaxID=7906 RepID=UPI002741DB18|nr:tyrosine-protein phosphatase non-receptor type 18-like isoform X1 [Acipenser ruthenus]
MEEHLWSFLELVKSLKPNGDKENGIATEYSRIRSQSVMNKQNKDLTTEAGGVKENIKKNRYKDILPYDQTRVTLLSDQGSSDYINASFIKGATEKRCYIATQGPLSHTVVDIWRMIWQYKVKVCIMACREIEHGKKKCERYWAGHSETSVFGDFVITNIDESSPNADITIRTLSVQCRGEIRTLSHFQYTAWPDHGIPSDCDRILDMMEDVHSRQGSDTAPILVHCSAGCGRTGVICAVDYVRDLLLTERITSNFSILDIVLEIRKQRPSAVQTKEQYEFLYYTVAQMFQKALKRHDNDYENVSVDNACLYDDVEYLNQIQKPLLPTKTKTVEVPKNKPPLSPRPSLPSPHKNMSDTYAVVNKTKPRLPPDNPTAATTSPAPPKTRHEYDNAEAVSTNRQPPGLDALYSMAKPKAQFPSSPNKQAAPPAFPLVPIYSTASPPPRTGVNAGLQERETYDTANSRNSSSLDRPSYSNRTQKSDSLSSLRKNSGISQSTDDNYEYVTGSPQGIPSDCTTSGLGFNCRVGKPKGPRDPPFEWSQVET